MNEEKTSRSVLLSALCILTFIGSTVSFITFFLGSVFFDKASEIIIKYSSWHSVESISPFYFTMFMALSAISLIGAIRMWKLHRDGFFVYTISQLCLLCLPVIWIGADSFSATGAIFTAVFIGGYSLSIKQLH